jgi:hypothetical protein
MLKGKQVDSEKVREITIARRAEKRAKVADLLKGLDCEEKDILFESFINERYTAGRSELNIPGRIKLECSGGCPECHCPECHCPECVSYGNDRSRYIFMNVGQIKR